jgi:hypothetical protein
MHLDHIPARQNQWRRGKKLMTMDEVNERFPFLKYKDWAVSRASERLSTNNNISVTAPPCRATRLGEPNSVLPLSAADAKQLIHSGSDDVLTAEAHIKEDLGEAAGKCNSMKASAAERGAAPQTNRDYYSLDEVQTAASTVDDHNTAVARKEGRDGDAPELLTLPAASCAICISTLEQDHDIRGLTCGHAFHVGCLDPWLTTRRACCPLCKTEYYVPLSCTEGEASETGDLGRPISSSYPGDGVID